MLNGPIDDYFFSQKKTIKMDLDLNSKESLLDIDNRMLIIVLLCNKPNFLAFRP